MIGGKSLQELNESDLMKHVVLVRHNSYLFKGTVEENLMMAKPDATAEEMETVLEKVNLLGFLQSQDGLQTKLLLHLNCWRSSAIRYLLSKLGIFLGKPSRDNVI